MAGSRTLTEFRKLTLDSLQVGEEFVSDDHLVIPEDIETHGFAVEDDHPWLAEGTAPPTLMANQALHLRHSKYIVHAGLHARMEFNFLEPIRLGMRVRTKGKVIDKYERRGQALHGDGVRHRGRYRPCAPARAIHADDHPRAGGVPWPRALKRD